MALPATTHHSERWQLPLLAQLLMLMLRLSKATCLAPNDKSQLRTRVSLVAAAAAALALLSWPVLL
jgi:integral membrane sensor domain MASE1